MSENPVVILTREPEDNLALARRLSLRRMDFVEYPCIKTVPVRTFRNILLQEEVLRRYGVVVFTSRRAVQALEWPGKEMAFKLPRIASVGERTAEEIHRHIGRKPWLVAEPPTAESLAQRLVKQSHPGETLLHVRGSRTTGILKKVLTHHGLHLDEVVVYRHEALVKEPLKIPGQAIVVLASPSAARCFLEYNSGLKSRLAFLAIGPMTACCLKGMNLSGVYQAKRPEPDFLLSEILRITREHDFQEKTVKSRNEGEA